MPRQGPAEQAREIPLTARGAATRDRIVRGAADLMYVKGVSATTLDDVREATGTSKSQLYRHFPDKEALVRAVIALRGRQVIERETDRLGRLSSYRGLVRWRDALVAANALQNGAYGCALGADPEELAVSLMAAVQGGYLLANTAHDTRPMEISIDLALEHLKSYLA